MNSTETNKKETFSAKQAQLLKHLAEGKSISVACREIKINRSCYYKWIKDPNFKRACDQLSNFSFKYLSQEIGQAAMESLDVLRKLLASREEIMRFKSATALIDMVLKIRFQVEIEERLQALENNYQAQQDKVQASKRH